MSTDTSSRSNASLTEQHRDLRGRLGNPDGSSEQDTETWQDFLQRRGREEEEANSQQVEAVNSYFVRPLASLNIPGGPEPTSGVNDTAQLGQSHETITLPRWQPDYEASDCPVCGVEFTFWFRKHHCRKCGRVICANCSPHRITIPRPYIVQPPGSESTIDPTVIQAALQLQQLRNNSPTHHRSLSSQPSENPLGDPSLTASEEVRICNPCVPDPNTSPPPLSRPHRRAASYAADNRPVTPGGMSPEGSGGRYTRPRRRMSRRQEFEQFYALGQPMLDPMHAYEDLLRRHRSQDGVVDAGARARGQSDAVIGDYTRGVNANSNYPLQAPGLFTPSNVYSNPLGDPSINPPNPRQARYLPPHITRPSIVPQIPPFTPYRPQHPAIHPAIRSPFVDGSRLPPPGFAVASNNVGPGADLNFHAPWEHQQSRLSAPRPPLPESELCPCCHASYTSLGISSSSTTREAHVQACVQATSASPTNSTHPIPTQPRHGSAALHTVYFVLDEKEAKSMMDSGSSECVICMDEFAVGQEMARLECWCRFHKGCIEDWFRAPGQGGTRCPVHLHW